MGRNGGGFVTTSTISVHEVDSSGWRRHSEELKRGGGRRGERRGRVKKKRVRGGRGGRMRKKRVRGGRRRGRRQI